MRIKPQTILIICDYKSLYGGNFIASLVALNNELQKSGWKGMLLFPEGTESRVWYKELKKLKICVDTIDFSKNAKIIKQVRRKIKDYQVEIVYFHFGHVLAAECLSFMMPKKIRVFIHIHSDFSAGKKNFKVNIRNTLLFKHCLLPIKFLCVSKKMSSECGSKSVYVPNGIANERMSSLKITGEEFRSINKIPKDTYLCEIFGWSPEIKGVDIAVSAVEKLYERGYRNIMLAIICGRNMTEDKMKQFIREHTNCSGNELFLRFFEPNEDVFRYHLASNIHLSASRSEGFSYSILEMLSIGKKCVISDIPGVQWAKKYDSVIAFDSEDIEACANAIEKSIMLPEKNRKVRDKVLQEYSIKKWTESVMNVLLGEKCNI